MSLLQSWLTARLEKLAYYSGIHPLDFRHEIYTNAELFRVWNYKYKIFLSGGLLLACGWFVFLVTPTSLGPLFVIFISVLLQNIIVLIFDYRFFYRGYLKVLYSLHSILPNKEQRHNEVSAYFETMQLLKDKKDLEVSSTNLDSIKDEYLSNKKEFCLKHFGIKSASFVQFYDDRAIDSITGQVVEGYLFFSLLLPKKNELSHDAIRRCLQHYPTPSDLGSLGLEEYLSLKENIPKMFSNYTPIQIERLYTNYQGSQYFYKLLQFQDIILPIAKNFQELYSLLCARQLPEKFQKINGLVVDGYTIRVLITKLEYEQASLSFENCVKSYSGITDTFILIFMDGLIPEACVSIKGNSLVEIKGVRNSSFLRKNDILNILKDRGIIK